MPVRPLRSIAAIVVILLPLAGPVAAQQYCYAVGRPDVDQRLAFVVDGLVEQVLVEEGQLVKAGDPLIRLQADEEKALVEVYKIRVASDVAMKAAKTQLKLAELEEKRAAELLKQNAGTELQYETAKVNAELRRIEVEAQEQAMAETKLQLAQAAARLAQRTLVAKQGGQVEDIIVSEGEPVTKLQPIIRVIGTDVHRAEVAVPTNESNLLKEGDPAWIIPRVSWYEGAPIEGKIFHKGRDGDGASSTLLVTVKFDNPSNLPSGVQVAVTFSAPKELAAAGETRP